MSIMGDRIRQKRIENNMSMEELGDRLGVKKTAVSKWELGEVENIKRSSIEKMSYLFGCPPQWLMGFDDSNDVKLKYSAEGKEPIEVTVDARPIIGPASKRAELYEAALNVKEENIDVAINLLKSLS